MYCVNKVCVAQRFLSYARVLCAVLVCVCVCVVLNVCLLFMVTRRNVSKSIGERSYSSLKMVHRCAVLLNSSHLDIQVPGVIAVLSLLRQHVLDWWHRYGGMCRGRVIAMTAF